jgi:hypothetical protein
VVDVRSGLTDDLKKLSHEAEAVGGDVEECVDAFEDLNLT